MPQLQLRRQRLREATAPAHRDLENAMTAIDYFDSVAGYRRYLETAASFYGSLEEALDGAGARQVLPDWPRRRKAALALAGSRVLGPSGDERRCPAVGPAIEAPRHAGDIWGALYVMEGATLGGAVLARRMAPLGITRGHGGGLLDPYGPDRGMMWRTFLERLEAAQLSDDEDEALCSSAEATFALFRKAFAPCRGQ